MRRAVLEQFGVQHGQTTKPCEYPYEPTGVRYVVDAGRSKQKLQMSSSGAVARYEVDWISKASAAQRAGRAGRTGPGHCYRCDD